MSRKVFISFLGTNKYTECVYKLSKQRSSVVKFVQSALAELFVKEKGDKYFVFTTQGAIAENWQGLQNEINRITPNVPIENIEIPEGKNEQEIWKIFQLVFDCLEERDEVFFDITHGFRSLPLLASALLQYAKFLKNISVKAIYYGAFETLGVIKDVLEKYPNPADRIVPVFDLTAFSEIQDWAAAANNFISFGNTKQLSQLTHSNIIRIIQNQNGSIEETTKDINTLNKNIVSLSNEIKTNRGKDIIEGKSAEKIVSVLQTLEQSSIPALNPILEQIKTSVEKIFVAKNDVGNMLAAVNWCIDKQLVQEGLTILQEGIITLLLNRDYCNREKRQVVSGYLQNQNQNNFENKTKLTDNEVEKLKRQLENVPQIKTISETYKNISDIRNDINHAGMNSSPRSADKFDKELRELYNKVKTALYRN
jgi:CRISPR-associated DxTHG motif protein